jgi:hypothetical protein
VTTLHSYLENLQKLRILHPGLATDFVTAHSEEHADPIRRLDQRLARQARRSEERLVQPGIDDDRMSDSVMLANDRQHARFDPILNRDQDISLLLTRNCSISRSFGGGPTQQFLLVKKMLHGSSDFQTGGGGYSFGTTFAEGVICHKGAFTLSVSMLFLM